MNENIFLNDNDVQGFITWAAQILRELPVNLNITRRGTGRHEGLGPGVQGAFEGIDAIANAYHWRASWHHPTVGEVISSDWPSTQASLNRLREWLREEINRNPPFAEDCLSACEAIVRWGGDRNDQRGAMPFLRGKGNLLPEYLLNSQRILKLDEADIDDLNGIGEMNAMLSKVHALAADDGLPIYDSRVAGAIGALVELHRQGLENPWIQIPETLRFKATAGASRRRVRGLRNAGPGALDPGVITRDRLLPLIARRAREWSSCKIRLAWLIEAILERAELNGNELFHGEASRVENMHAFEAALFMIGFDVTCLLADRV